MYATYVSSPFRGFAIHNLRRYSNSLAHAVGTHERWFQMVIRTVQANDYGDYICEGRNDQGTGYAVVTLFG